MKKLITSITLLVAFLMSVQFTFADVGNSFAGSSSSSSGDGFFFISTGNFLVDLAIIVVVVMLIYQYRQGNLPIVDELIQATKETNGTTVGSHTILPEATVAQMITERDENFSTRVFKGYAQEVFIQIQEAWESRDMSIVRPLETDELFNRHQQQIQEYIQKDWYPHLDGQCIDSVELTNTYQESNFEYLMIRLRAKVIDFTTDAEGRVVQGNKTAYQHRAYRLTFKRHLSVLTGTQQTLSTKSCPNCGAPTSVGAAGECEFCGSIVTTGEHNWVLENYEAWR